MLLQLVFKGEKVSFATTIKKSILNIFIIMVEIFTNPLLHSVHDNASM